MAFWGVIVGMWGCWTSSGGSGDVPGQGPDGVSTAKLLWHCPSARLRWRFENAAVPIWIFTEGLSMGMLLCVSSGLELF